MRINQGESIQIAGLAFIIGHVGIGINHLLSLFGIFAILFPLLILLSSENAFDLIFIFFTDGVDILFVFLRQLLWFATVADLLNF